MRWLWLTLEAMTHSSTDRFVRFAGPAAPYAVRARHCDCWRLGLRRAECTMPASGVVEPDAFEAYETERPEGPQRSCAHAYVCCIALVRSTEDCDW